MTMLSEAGIYVYLLPKETFYIKMLYAEVSNILGCIISILIFVNTYTHTHTHVDISHITNQL